MSGSSGVPDGYVVTSRFRGDLSDEREDASQINPPRTKQIVENADNDL